MKTIARIGLVMIFIMIILVSLTGCRNLAPVTGTPDSSVNDMNGSANLAKGGFAAIQDGWIYYSYYTSSDFDQDLNGLYKMKADGTNKIKICNGDIDYINIIEDWIYFNDYPKGIYKIKADGTEKKKIWNGHEINDLNVVANQAYFSADWKSLCKMNISENEMEVINNDNSGFPNMHIVNDWIYFYSANSYVGELKERNIYKMRIDGTEKLLAMQGEVYDFTVAGDWIYYINKTESNDTLVKVKIDGTECQILAENANLDGLNVAGNWVYYLVAINDEDEIDMLFNLYKIKLDGTGCQKIAEEIYVFGGMINIAGDWIFYQTDEGDLYRIKTDGTNEEMLVTDLY